MLKLPPGRFLKALFLLSTLFFLSSDPASAGPKPAYVWTSLKTGVEYAKIETVHAFRIDPKKFQLKTVQAKTQNATAKTLAEQSKALLLINGTFFSPEGKTLGLIVNKGKILNAIHSTSWWSVFYIAKNRAAIVPPAQFRLNPNVEMAIQVGPRLVVNNQIPRLKNGLARRSAIGITAAGKIVLVVSEAPLHIQEMAEIMQKSRWQGGLECLNAMALDGGGSTQLYAKIATFTLDIPGLSLIPNGVGLFPR